MPKRKPEKLSAGITQRTRKEGAKRVPVFADDGTPVYWVRVWNPKLQRQDEQMAVGLDAAVDLLVEMSAAVRRPGRTAAQRLRVSKVAARYLVAYKTKRDGTNRPRAPLAKERTCLNIYVLPALGNAWIGDLDLPGLNDVVRNLTLQDGSAASGSTNSTVAGVIRRMFAWAREERIITINPALELRTGWGRSLRRRVIIPSIPQVMRLAAALDHFKPGLGDVTIVLAFTGLRWEEAVALLVTSVDVAAQSIGVSRTASESGGRRDVRDGMKTSAAFRTVMIPDIAMPAVRRLIERGREGRERSGESCTAD